MKRVFICSLFILINLPLMATKPIVLYKKKTEGKILYLLYYKENSNTIFETLMTGKDGTKTVLNRSYTGNPLFNDKQKLSFFTIIDFTFRGDSVYIFYNDFGRVFMDIYTVVNGNRTDLKRIPIGAFKTLSYENFGALDALCEIKWIGDDLYFHIQAWQQFGGGLIGLYQYNHEKLQKIRFREDQCIIKTLHTDRWGIGWYEENKDKYQDIPVQTGDQDPKQERYQLLSRFYGKPYDYYLMGNKGMKYMDELTWLKNAGLISYPLLSLNEEKKLGPDMLEKAEKGLKQILALSGYDSSKVILTDYLYSRERSNLLYLFYKDQEIMNIVTYYLSQNDWVIGTFTKEDINEYPARTERSGDTYLKPGI